MKKNVFVFVCAILSYVSLYSQESTTWNMGGITFPLVPGMEITVSSDAAFTAKGNGIIFRIQTIGDVNSHVVSLLMNRAAGIEKDVQVGYAPVPESVPDAFYEYL